MRVWAPAVWALAVWALAVWALAVLLLGGCGSSDERPAPSGCPSPQIEQDGACVDPPAEACPAGSWVDDDGLCRPAGLSVDFCGEGFGDVDEVACGPLLPAGPCAEGTMATPGDTACQPVMDCGDGPWGSLPVDAATIYVDASYGGAMSDGSAGQPFTMITDAVQAAPSGALIAVAQGSYPETVAIAGKAVRLWGRCPDLVEIVSQGGASPTLLVAAGADATEIGGLAVSGPGIGIGVSGASATVRNVWVHDTGDTGIDVVTSSGLGELVLEESLVERATGLGLRALGTSLEATRVVVRATEPLVGGSGGRGVSLHAANALFHLVVIEDNRDVGLRLAGSSLVATSSVVQRTQPQADGSFGRGVSVATLGATGEPSYATLENVAVRESHDVGVFTFGSTLAADNLWVADTFAEPSTDSGGLGLNVQVDDNYELASNATLRGVHITRSHDAGVRVAASVASIERLLVEHTMPRASTGRFGYGIVVEADPITKQPAEATIVGSRIAANSEVGVLVFEASVTLDKLWLQDTSTAPDGTGGDGIVVLSQPMASSALIRWSRIDNSPRAAIGNFGALVSLAHSELTCQAFDLNGEPSAGLDFVFDDGGGNLCGCPDPVDACKSLSSGLAPPSAL
jgi:hypothetical protein